MAFMRPEVTDKQEWAEVETNSGTWWVPFDILSSSETESARRGDFEPLLQYTEGTEAYNEQSGIKKGYGVRLSAPGYMDATDWEIYGAKKEALKRARELAREAEGEDYATKKRSHATKKSPAQLDREIAHALSQKRARKAKRETSSAMTFNVAKEAWDDDPTVRTAQKYRHEARKLHQIGMISNSALEAILAETAAYVR
jgi:hypothetical protein